MKTPLCMAERGGGLLFYVSTHSLVKVFKTKEVGHFLFYESAKTCDIMIHFLRCWTDFGNGLLLVSSQDFVEAIVQIIVF
jgi:hypothetical protein